MTGVTRQRKRAAVTGQSSESVSSGVVVRGEYAGTPRESYEIEVHKFITEPAYVRVSTGLTKNLGNYESLRVDVSITMPCYAEQVEEVYQRTAENVSRLLTAEVDLYTEGEDA